MEKENKIIEELTPRWAIFVDLYLQTGNAYQSAIQAGFSEDYSRVITTRIPDKVRKSMKDALESKGIDSFKIADKIGILLEATNGDKPDYNAIDKGITHALKLGVGGGYEPEKSIVVEMGLTEIEQAYATRLLASQKST